MKIQMLLLIVAATHAVTNTRSCKDMLQGYLTGQLSSALGAYQVEALKREFKSFAEVIEKSMKEFKENMKSEVKIHTGNSSVVYTRWGKKTCPSNAELVHSGFTGGSHYTHKGAAVEPLCLSKNPEWGLYNDGHNEANNYVYGAEYETARKTCYKGWTLEYHGYLMASYYDHNAGTTYTCIDSHPDTLHGRLFYPVEAACGSLKCPPYIAGKELVCAVCSKE